MVVGVAPGRGGAAALVDVAGYKNADALVHVVRAFRDESVPPASGSVDPARDAQAMEDELILADLGLTTIRVLTNNPRKISGISGFGLTAVSQEPIEIEPNDHNRDYLETKRDKLGHTIGRALHHQGELYDEDDG